MALGKVSQIKHVASVGAGQPAQAPVADVAAPLDQFVTGASGLSTGSTGRLASGLWSAPKGPGAEIIMKARVSTLGSLEANRIDLVKKIEVMARSSRKVDA